MKEKHIRALGMAILGGLGAFIASGSNEPGSTWELLQLCAGIATAALTGLLAQLSKHSGLNP